MTFDELISLILELKKNSGCKSIKLNSKFIKKNDIFISISEDSKKNLENVSDAISKGAQLIISSDKDQKNKADRVTNKFRFDLHGLNLDEANKKVKEIIQELNIPNLKVEEFIRLKIGD